MYIINNISYDTDGEDFALPEQIFVEDNEIDPEYDLLEQLSDLISDRTGFCHFGFEYKEK